MPHSPSSDASARALDNLGFARVDLDRLRRQGVPEVVYGVEILSSLRNNGQLPALVTRIDGEKAAEAAKSLGTEFTYFPDARLGRLGPARAPDGLGVVAVAAAGTSDIPVAEEAALTAETLGNEVKRLYDVGVAGLHRIVACADDLASASVVVAVAGMEGALASVVGGIVSCPVIAVPTSVGYGASFGGLSALLSMLNSCASGVTVVNIDNGFGAAYSASMINHIGVR